MCGISGFTGVKDATARHKLVTALGVGIDARGGHAAGYVSVMGSSAPIVRLAKRVGEWTDSSSRFRFQAGQGETLMMHSRMATCGREDLVSNAHPFAIRREGKTVLYGCHNGMLQGTYVSAALNKREHTVDSREMLELLADGDHAAIRRLSGYGIVTWIVPGSPVVHVLRLSNQSDISCMHLESGGIAWASTWSILSKALDYAGEKAVGEYTLPDVGRVYELHPGMVHASDTTNITVSKSWYAYGGYDHTYGWGDDELESARDLSDEEIDAELLRQDEKHWENMTSAEWERWGRWSSDSVSKRKDKSYSTDIHDEWDRAYLSPLPTIKNIPDTMPSVPAAKKVAGQ